jgi:nitronate monooxygenase
MNALFVPTPQASGWLQTDIVRLLGCKYPIIQTAMGWVADARLTAATCNAGGFGFLAAATIPADRIEAEIARLKSLTDKPFGVNFHMFQPNAAQVIELCIEHKVRAVSYGRGPDKATVKRLKDAGVLCIPTVGAVKHAVKAVQLGADAVTVQGGEGGGHTGSVPTTILLPQVLDAVSVPVLAAGGYYNGRGLASALAAGASGVAMGTRFLMTRESPVPSDTLARYLKVDDVNAIAVSHAVDGLPQRMIANAYLDKLEHSAGWRRLAIALGSAWQWKRQTGMSAGQMLAVLGKSLKEDRTKLAETLMAANAPVLIQRAMVDGHPDEGVLPSGQAAAAIAELLSCEQLISSLVAEAEACLAAVYNRQPSQQGVVA